MMTISEFNELSVSQKYDLLLEWGFFLGSTTKGEYSNVLYLFGDFFVELTIHIPDNAVLTVKQMEELDEESARLLPMKHPLAKAALSLSKKAFSHKAA